MNCRLSRCLRGPNVWASCPVFEGVLDFGGDPTPPFESVRQAVDRICVALSDAATGCDIPARKARAEVSYSVAVPAEDAGLCEAARAFVKAAIELQSLADSPASFAAVRPTGSSGVFQVAIGFTEETVGMAAADAAARLLAAALAAEPCPLDDDLRHLRELSDERLLPASTEVVYEAARARGIPTAQLSPEYRRFLRLGQGSKQHRCRASEPDSISAVARTASTDKHLAKQLLAAAGVPVPEGRLVSTADEAWAAAAELGVPVAVKPQDADLATGVSLDLRTRQQIEAAFHAAHDHSAEVLVERFAPGLEHRVLVVAGRVEAVSRIEPPHVVGDGSATIADLAAKVNLDPRRGDDGSDAPLRRLKLDETGLDVLAAQGYSPASVPAAGQRVLLRRNPPYLMHGGSLTDLTDCIHPSVAAHAVAAAEALQLRVAGLDVVVPDIGRPLEEQGGVVVEINVSPGLWLHIAPWADSPRPVGEAIVASMFPPGEDGRIPVVAVVGDATVAVTKHLSALLAASGRRVGIAGEEAIVVGPRHWSPPAGTPQDRAALVLQNPTLDVAILETSPRELLDSGFGNDRCNVAIVLEREAGDFLLALRNALTPNGTFVLLAEQDTAGVELPLPAPQIALVARRADHPRVSAHLAADGTVVTVQGDALVAVRGSEPAIVLGPRGASVADGDLPGLLAALAAGLALGLDAAVVQNYVRGLS